MNTRLPPPPPPPPPPPARQHGRLAGEVMAGGSVSEIADDELVGGWRGAFGVAVIIGLFGLLAAFSIWWFVFAVGILLAIALHELGHFATARWTGMKATQFFIGFGPRVWSFRRGETEYGVRALPLGAFVRIVGMNNMDVVDDPADEARSYRSKSYPRRMLVITAGSLMHMILAAALLFTVYVIDGEPSEGQPGVYLQVVDPVGAGAAAGLRPGDVVMSIGGTPVDATPDLGTVVRTYEPADVVDFVVVRGGETMTIPVGLGANTDEASPYFGDAYIGVASGVDRIRHSVPAAAGQAVWDLFPTAWEMTKGVVQVLNPVNIITHVAGTNDDLATRPTTLVGVTALSDDIGEAQGLTGILYLLAALNVFIGVFNMFPLLPLDGGHAAIATYERLRERNGIRYHADVAKLMPIAMVVMTVLAFLFLSGLYLDIVRPIG